MSMLGAIPLPETAWADPGFDGLRRLGLPVALLSAAVFVAPDVTIFTCAVAMRGAS